MSYGIKRAVHLPFDVAVQKTRDALAAQGFGILHEIDVRKTLKQKLNVDHPNYVILGACKPDLAHDALRKDKLMGLFMPCNVVVYEDDGKVFVAAHEIAKVAGLLENDELRGVLAGVEALLRKALATI
ncbi:DUF302 domain-containing protein [Candidatus Woesearchaeota archaeon]|nr:DUF302 domain-containing protein [Candidatus Woesearchaeota archaeon]